MRLVLFIYWIALITTFQSCGIIHRDFRPAEHKPNQQTNPEFYPYIQEFESYSKLNTSQVPISFANLEGNTAGVCHYFRMGEGPIRWGYIEIDEPNWKLMSQNQKVNLIFHELGHCVLGRDHTPKNSVEACPSSFMDDTILSNYCLELHYKDYLHEMFPSISEQ